MSAVVSRITCVIAEDERLFRDALVSLLAEVWPSLEVVAQCDDGAAALEEIGERKPDIAFLDIRMPGMTGLEVAAALADVSPATRVVFVTAYDQYAIDAFEKGAIDYLLKPIARERLEATVKRLQAAHSTQVSDSVKNTESPADMQQVIAAIARQLGSVAQQGGDQEKLVWLTASSGRETRLIMVDDVIYFQSDNKYTVVMTADGESLLRTSLTDIIARLDSSVFRQIHRGSVVNLRKVAAIIRDESGRGTMKLKGRSETLTVSLSFMPFFKNM
jgi:DNA-binding LytR/AlgR family response regulator